MYRFWFLIFFLRYKEERKLYYFIEIVKMFCKILKEEIKLVLWFGFVF